MSAVFDVVQTIAPGARTSVRSGTWLVAVFDDPRRAERHANTCREFATVSGVAYAVERHDEESPDRAPWEADYVRGEAYALSAVARREALASR